MINLGNLIGRMPMRGRFAVNPGMRGRFAVNPGMRGRVAPIGNALPATGAMQSPYDMARRTALPISPVVPPVLAPKKKMLLNIMMGRR